MLLAEWANQNDEWVRFLVAEVISTGRAISDSTIEMAYQLFRQEKSIDRRELPPVGLLSTEARRDEAVPPLLLKKLGNVRGVNALVAGAVIEPHEGLTILYGENGTGKTGYSRIFKALADSRTADAILGNIEAEAEEDRSATLEYTLGSAAEVLQWTGEQGVSPFTRMSIFDTPAVSTHVDEDLAYVYVPASLAIFNHMVAAIQAVVARLDAAAKLLQPGNSGLLNRFQRGSAIYPLIETLGASTDLSDLRSRAASDDSVEGRIESLTQAVAALSANTISVQINLKKRDRRVLEEALRAAESLLLFDTTVFNNELSKRARLIADYETFRSQLFAAADLPAEPDDTWSRFVDAGEAYRQHLVGLGVHDASRCLYCRQPMGTAAQELISRYASYLEDKISADIRDSDGVLGRLANAVTSIQSNEIVSFIKEFEDRDDKPAFFTSITVLDELRRALLSATSAGHPVDADVRQVATAAKTVVVAALGACVDDIEALELQSQNRVQALSDKQRELLELKDSAELAKSWPLIETAVNNAKEVDRLGALKRPLPALARAVTALAKTASDELINQSFDTLFLEECEALRAPTLKVQFVGREGKAQRRKVLSGRHKPSKVLSEGEQKVLAIADFLAEARLAGITAPIIFDDPVSSLDHRRVNEVAQRIARLAENNQVIVFTHDVLFATTLLALFETTKRCVYYQITDEDGKGKVTHATGPRWDTLSGIRGKINSIIQAAKGQDGEARDALVRAGYGWLRSWCEVFTETELLQGVTQRYQPNVGMTRLPKINTSKLGTIVPVLTEVFEEACRYIDGHSQPLPTLGVSPTVGGLEQHWAQLQDLKKQNDGRT
ncbi:AAA family ATPase [Mycolicibacterium nivoides]|uniref:AAA family ATPase n=1 Tax=Mycolicibacterium nivoides TaxID=2487344 RepID=UPI001F14C801|nr:AAA family ATPase [Mycolicibacterium nivoides]